MPLEAPVIMTVFPMLIRRGRSARRYDGASASPFHREIRPDLSTLALKLMAHKATFLAIEGLPIRDQVTLRLNRNRADGTEARKVANKGHELPGVSLRKCRFPGGHA